jgi:alcohol dehydrogenase class IV
VRGRTNAARSSFQFPPLSLHHEFAHVLGGLGLPHAETHAILLPHVTRFNAQADADASRRLREVFGQDDPALGIRADAGGFPIPQRLRDVGFSRDRIDFVAEEIAMLRAAACWRRGCTDVCWLPRIARFFLICSKI